MVQSSNQIKRKSARGFTLFELVVFMLIAGLLLTMFITFTKIYLRQRERDTNESAVEQIQAALDRFYSVKHYYPCPAGPAYALGHIRHARELRFEMPDVPSDATLIGPGIRQGRCQVAPGGLSVQPSLNISASTTAGGAIRVQGVRVDAAGTSVAISASPNPILTTQVVATEDTSVFIGDIPYNTINEVLMGTQMPLLPLSAIVDAYGQKFIYAVSAPMTHMDTVDPTKPNITVQKLNYRFTSPSNQLVAGASRSVPYLIVSSGRDRLGTLNAAAQTPNSTTCSAVSSTSSLFSRQENCDRDAVFLVTMGTNANLSYTTANATAANNYAGAKYFDDIISYDAYVESSLWKPADKNPSDMHNVNTGSVGIGKEPNTLFKLDVQGKSRADKLIAQDICSKDAVVGSALVPSGNCFDPRVITGNPDAGTGGMKCPSDMVLAKIGTGGLTTGLPSDTQYFTVTLPSPPGTSVKYACVKPKLGLPDVSNKTCPAGRWVTGFKSNGDVCCNGDTCS